MTSYIVTITYQGIVASLQIVEVSNHSVCASIEGILVSNDCVVVAYHCILRTFDLIVISLEDGILRAEDGVGQTKGAVQISEDCIVDTNERILIATNIITSTSNLIIGPLQQVAISGDGVSSEYWIYCEGLADLVVFELLPHIPGGLQVAEQIIREGEGGDVNGLGVEGVDQYHHYHKAIEGWLWFG